MQFILVKYFEGQATKDEQAKLLEWIRIKKNFLDFHRFSLVLKNSLNKNDFPGDSEENWNRIQVELLQKSHKRWPQYRKINYVFRYAAIFFMFVSAGKQALYVNGRLYLFTKNDLGSLLTKSDQES